MTSQQETLAAAHSVAGPAVTQTSLPTKPDSGRVRSDPVFLEVPVNVHGSRVVEVVRGTTPHTQPFEEQTATMIVFPDGAVLRMSTAVNAGQVVVLTNLTSGQDAIGRVAKVRPFGNNQAYVEVGFAKPQPGFWGVRFLSDAPADGSELEAKAGPATPAVAPPAVSAAPSLAEARANEHVVTVVTPAPAVPASIPAITSPAASAYSQSASPPNPTREPIPSAVRSEKASSAFVSIGEREEVQPAAAEPSGPRDRFSGSEKSSPVAEVLKAVAPPAAKPPEQNQQAPFGPSAADASFGATRTPSPATFGTRLGLGTLAGLGQIEEPRRSWVQIAACVALLLAAAAGGAAYYVHEQLAAEPPAIPVPVAPAPPAEPSAGQDSALQPAVQTNPAYPPADSPSKLADAVSAEGAPGGAAGVGVRPPGGSQLAPGTPPQSKVRAGLEDMSGALDAHPVSSRLGSAAESAAAPSLDAGAVSANGGNELPGVGASSVVLSRPPQTIPDGPVGVGGQVKPPRVVSSVQPTYPSIARQAGVEGSVVVRIVIDKAGNVVDAKAISGPEMLRRAAVDALRQWKYEASRLNGEPISVQMPVTIQFRR